MKHMPEADYRLVFANLQCAIKVDSAILRLLTEHLFYILELQNTPLLLNPYCHRLRLRTSRQVNSCEMA